jgi:superfamily II DNA or RNA helicase
VFVRVDGTIGAAAEGWNAAEWREVAETIADATEWLKPTIPIASDPGPFRGSPRTRLSVPRSPTSPVYDSLPAIREALSSASRAVLVAPPGAGKTTIVPLELLDEEWLAGRGS